MSPTCLNLHSAADFTVAHVSVCSYWEVVSSPTGQVGELAGGVGGVALQSLSHVAGGSSHVELHSLSFLPVHVGCTRPTLLVHSNKPRSAGPWTTCLVELIIKTSMINSQSMTPAQLFRDEMSINSRVLKVTLVCVSAWHWSLMVVRLML